MVANPTLTVMSGYIGCVTAACKFGRLREDGSRLLFPVLYIGGIAVCAADILELTEQIKIIQSDAVDPLQHDANGIFHSEGMGIFNGDIGVIEAINLADAMISIGPKPE